jgi:HrpA-like RNA helicase
MDALLVTEISQAAAIQRAGRAGRTAPGKAYRLYNDESFQTMIPDTVPEIQRSSLLSTILALKKMNIIDVLNFEFIDPPDDQLVRNALKQLYLLGALDKEGKITKLGDQMSYFPLSPSLSRVLIASASLQCSYEVLIIASILASDLDLFKSPSPRAKGGEQDVIKAEECKLKLAHHTGDHMTCLNVWIEWKANDKSRTWCKDTFINYKTLESADNVRSQLLDVMDKLNLNIVRAPRIQERKKSSSHRHRRRRVGQDKEGNTADPVPILQSFLAGYFTSLANKATHRSVFRHFAPDEHFNSDTATPASSALVALHLHPLCALSDMLDRHKLQYSELEWVMYTNITYTTKAVMKGVSKIVWDWVKNSDGHARIQQLPHARLTGEAQPNMEELDLEAQQKQEQIELEKMQHQVVEIEESKKRRAEEIDMIRQRALTRRRQQ